MAEHRPNFTENKAVEKGTWGMTGGWFLCMPFVPFSQKLADVYASNDGIWMAAGLFGITRIGSQLFKD